MCPSPDAPGRTGGVDVSGSLGSVAGDIVGRDKYLLQIFGDAQIWNLFANEEGRGRLIRKGRREALARPVTPTSNNANYRFVGRHEYFGSLLWDRENVDYIPFDQDATAIFCNAIFRPLDQIYEEFKNDFNLEEFQTFDEVVPRDKHSRLPGMVYRHFHQPSIIKPHTSFGISP
jgi:hypothetical protein